MKKNTDSGKNDGFTLIELLVVIAIIGILSSVVLASLGVARGKAADTGIKADFATIRNQAGLFYDANNQSYDADSASCVSPTSIFVQDVVIARAIAHAGASSQSAVICRSDDGVAGAGTAASSWAISVPLRSNPATSWCVDSTGIAAFGTASNVSNVAVCQ